MLMATAIASALASDTGMRAARGIDPESLLKARRWPCSGASSGKSLLRAVQPRLLRQFPGKIFALWEGGARHSRRRAGGIPPSGAACLRRGPPVRQYSTSRRELAIREGHRGWLGKTSSNEEAFGRPIRSAVEAASLPGHRPLQYAQ